MAGELTGGFMAFLRYGRFIGPGGPVIHGRIAADLAAPQGEATRFIGGLLQAWRANSECAVGAHRHRCQYWAKPSSEASRHDRRTLSADRIDRVALRHQAARADALSPDCLRLGHHDQGAAESDRASAPEPHSRA